MINYIVVGSFALISMTSLLKRRGDWLLYTLLASFVIGNWYIYIGTIFFPSKIIIIFICLYLLFTHQGREKVMSFLSHYTGWALFGTVVVSFVVSYMIEPNPHILISSSGLQNPTWRPVVQGYTYVSTLLVFPFVLAAIDTPQKLRSFFKVYLGIAIFSSLIALFQLVTIQREAGFIPIYRTHGEHSLGAAFVVGGETVSRLYGFAGEPKQLASFLLPAVMMLLTEDTWKNKKKYILVIICTTFIFTFSTAAFVGIAIGIFLQIVLMRRFMKSFKVFFVIFLLFLAMYIIFDVIQVKKNISFLDVLESRSIERLDKEKETRFEYQAVQYVFREKPVALFWGLGLGMYNFHLPNMTWRLGIEPIDSGWVTFFVDIGYIGILVFVLFLLKISKKISQAIYSSAGDIHTLQCRAFCCLIAATSMHLGHNLFVMIMLFAGVCEAASVINKRARIQ